MVIQYLVRLTEDQRRVCNEIVHDKRAPNRVKRRALVLLQADGSAILGRVRDDLIAEVAGVDPRTVVRIRATFVRQGFDVALHGRPRSTSTPPKLTPEQEARLLAMTTTPPPPGYPRWTIRTLAAGLRQFPDMPKVSRELVRRTLQRYNRTIEIPADFNGAA